MILEDKIVTDNYNEAKEEPKKKEKKLKSQLKNQDFFRIKKIMEKLKNES